MSKQFKSIIHSHAERMRRGMLHDHGSTALRKPVVEAASAEGNAMEGMLRENTVAAMTMDGGQVGPLGFAITNLVIAHFQCCFTAGIFKRDPTHKDSSPCTFPPSRALTLPVKRWH
jgi:hypothetical protein